jgi:hypothetical protein
VTNDPRPWQNRPAVPPPAPVGKKPKIGAASQIGIALVVISLLCCGGVTVNAIFNGDPEPGATTSAPRGVAALPTTEATTDLADALEGVLETPAPTATRTRKPSSRPAPTATKPTVKPTTKRPKPRPTTTKPKPRKTTKAPTSVYYKNCTAVRNAGADPIRRADPGYGRHLDRDGDGVGCE